MIDFSPVISYHFTDFDFIKAIEGRMLILHDMRVSGNCYKVRLLLALLDIAFKSRAIEPSAGQSSTSDFLALNPKGSVPFLEFDHGVGLSESNAILLYLAEDTPYLPRDKFLRAKVYEWLFFEQYYHEPKIAVRIALQTVATRKHLATAERMADLLAGGVKALAIMEAQLEKTPFIVGDAFSIADIALYAYTHKAGEGGFDLSFFPAIIDWLARVEKQERFVDMNWLPDNAALSLMIKP
mgnify:CR=1 FL=1